MKIIVMNRRNAINYCEQEHEETSVIISISDSCDKYPILKKTSSDLNNNVQDILFLSFDDIQRTSDMKWWKKDEGLILDQIIVENKVQYEAIYQLFTPKMAEKVVKFIDFYTNKTDILLVHCNAGVSRSSAVAAAVSKYLFGDDSFYFDSAQYHPNTTVYNILLDALVEKGKYKADNIFKKLEKT